VIHNFPASVRPAHNPAMFVRRICATGNWQLATGNWQLATGNWQHGTMINSRRGRGDRGSRGLAAGGVPTPATAQQINSKSQKHSTTESTHTQNHKNSETKNRKNETRTDPQNHATIHRFTSVKFFANFFAETQALHGSTIKR
jgi:hypothetical protein